MNQELFVPLFEWLVGGSRIGGGYNRYYGSQTERPAEAAWGQRVFNYAVYIEKIDDAEYLRAAVWCARFPSAPKKRSRAKPSTVKRQVCPPSKPGSAPSATRSLPPDKTTNRPRVPGRFFPVSEEKP